MNMLEMVALQNSIVSFMITHTKSLFSDFSLEKFFQQKKKEQANNTNEEAGGDEGNGEEEVKILINQMNGENGNSEFRFWFLDELTIGLPKNFILTFLTRFF